MATAEQALIVAGFMVCVLVIILLLMAGADPRDFDFFD